MTLVLHSQATGSFEPLGTAKLLKEGEAGTAASHSRRLMSRLSESSYSFVYRKRNLVNGYS